MYTSICLFQFSSAFTSPGTFSTNYIFDHSPSFGYGAPPPHHILNSITYAVNIKQ